MSSNRKTKSPLINLAPKAIEITDKTEIPTSKKVTDDSVNETSDLNEINNPSETSSKTRTSSDLLYSEYVKTENAEKICGMFESIKKKPLIQPYGESPLYKKYSALLKELQESKDDCPTECGENLPVVEIHCLVKQKKEDNSDDSDCDIEDSRLIFYNSDKENSDSSDEETTSEEEENTTESMACN